MMTRDSRPTMPILRLANPASRSGGGPGPGSAGPGLLGAGIAASDSDPDLNHDRNCLVALTGTEAAQTQCRRPGHCQCRQALASSLESPVTATELKSS